MTALGNWASGFCMAGIACALLSALCPKGTVRQGFGVLTALLMLCSLTAPVTILVNAFEDGAVVPLESTDVPQVLSETVSEQVVSILEATLYADAVQRLENSGLTLKRIHVDRDMRETSDIYIQKVRLVFDQADHPVDAAAVQRLSMAWGVPTEVYYDKD